MDKETHLLVLLTGFFGFLAVCAFETLQWSEAGYFSWLTLNKLVLPHEDHPTDFTLINDLYNWVIDQWVGWIIMGLSVFFAGFVALFSPSEENHWQ